MRVLRVLEVTMRDGNFIVAETNSLSFSTVLEVTMRDGNHIFEK